MLSQHEGKKRKIHFYGCIDGLNKYVVHTIQLSEIKIKKKNRRN